MSEPAIPESELSWSFARSGGPGGQNVNKVESKAVLRWNVASTASLPAEAKERLLRQQARRVTTEGDLLVTSQRYRDQDRNRTDCLEKLAGMVQTALTPPRPRRATRPGRAARERRLDDKRKRSETKANRRVSE
jgi:ribosome-associated protein